MGQQPRLRSMVTPTSPLARAMQNVLEQHRGSAHPFRDVRVHAADPKLTEIVEQLKTLTLFEAADLVAKAEDAFGAVAVAGVAAPGAPGAAGGAAEAAEEKTTF